jgi:hypothetical protein
VRILAGFVAVGALLGIAVPLPAFAILLVIISISYAVLSGDDPGWIGRFYDFVLTAVALQIGYFLAILVRTLIRSKSATTRVSDAKEEKDTKH